MAPAQSRLGTQDQRQLLEQHLKLQTRTAPDGTVTGTKYAPPVAASPSYNLNAANCLPAGSVTQSPETHVYQAGADVNYAAAIRTPTGQLFGDHGTSDFVIDEESGYIYAGTTTPNVQDFLYERFTSNQSTTTPLSGDDRGDN